MFVLFIIIALTASYFLLKEHYKYWRKRGLNGPKPTLFIGNMGKSAVFKEQLGTIYSNIYKEFRKEELVGIYRFLSPVLLVTHPEGIKEITVKSFNHFRDNDIHLDPNVDPIFGKNPFILKGEEWKIVRGYLTPGFTSGKMKSIYPLLEEISKKLVEFIENKKECFNGNGYEAKELAIRFTLNNVASCAFGLEGNCFQEEDSDFRKLSKEIFAFDGILINFTFLLAFLYPKISTFLPFRIVSKNVEQQLLDIVSQTLKHRAENNVIRNDFLHILSQLKTTANFTDLDVTAHAAGFFADGSETSSVVMSFALFELAQSPDKQRILREEISKVYKENLPYETLQNLAYLDAVIKETLRLHPPIPMLQKLCTADYVYKMKNGKSIKITKDTCVVLPVLGLHTDPEYYPEPFKFKPERFLEENKHLLTPYTFLAFGEGPRQCLGQRFGVLQIKIGIANIIQHFELSVNDKTILPIKYDPKNPLTSPIGGLWLNFKKIL